MTTVVDVSLLLACADRVRGVAGTLASEYERSQWERFELDDVACVLQRMAVNGQTSERNESVIPESVR